METPGQQSWEPAPEPVLCAMEAARLFGLDPKEAIATVLLADDLRVAPAEVRLLSAAMEGLDRLNGAVNLSERP